MKIVVNTLVVVTVTVTTRWPDGQAVASAVVQSLTVGVVLENTPVFVAHSQRRAAEAETPVMFVALTAVVCIVAVLPLFVVLAAPH